ncbi:hypothetical protein BHE90_000872 [Fusarium euwallaceae]|uniref:Uncharacterized protein n=1 Tax=Fusarium euwallaceae TaxID=1147111 RepID=A0A430M9B0_9HYPO|nr:hypothetical protein BHE90_000872 [Fusarium euwallaceae]
MTTTALHIQQKSSFFNNNPMARPKLVNPPKSKDDAPSFSVVACPETQAEKQSKSSLWDEAIEKLSKDDKAWINGNSQQFLDSSGPGIRGIIALVDEKRQECEAKRWTTVKVFKTTISLSDLASNAITWLNKFKEVGDTIVQYDPGHAGLPWAATRFILQSAISYQEHMAFSLISIEKTTRIVHRCQIYELLYNCGTLDAQVVGGLEKALVDLYASLLHVLARVGKFLCKDTANRSLYAVLRPTEGTDLLSELEKLENEVIKEASVCESKRSAESDSKSQEQVQKLQSLLRLEEPVLRIDENVQKVLEKMEMNELIHILDWISPLEYNQPHQRVKEARTKGTCNWIVEQPKFYEWQSESSSITFWLQGFGKYQAPSSKESSNTLVAGTGKTFITSRVIDLVAETLQSKRNHEGFAYFYCNQTEPTRRQALLVLRSFIRQLSSPKSMSGHLDPKLKQLYLDSRLNGAGWTLDLCKEILVHLFNLYPHTTIILDALDECETEERRLLLNIFDWASKSSSRPVKIFISSRPEADIRQRLVHLSNLEISAKNNGHDIADFIKQSSENEGLWNIALAGNPVLKEEIVQTLIEKSDGKFQWARLQIDQLRVIDHVKDLRARLGKLPKDLKSSYDEIYQRILDRPEYSRVRTLRALKWVMVAPFPLSTEQLLDAIRVDPYAEEIDEPGEVTEEQLIGWCANLLFLDKTQNYNVPTPAVWRPCHLSVVEYLEERFTMPTAHMFVTMALLFLLISQPDESEQEELVVQYHARRYWMVFVQKYDKPSIDFNLDPYDKLVAMLKRFLGSPTQSSDAYNRWVQLVDSVGLQSGLDMGRLLVKYGADANQLPPAGIYGSALIAACHSFDASPAMIEFLIENGAEVNAIPKAGRYGSALASVIRNEFLRVERHSRIDFLIEHGADINLVLPTGLYGSALISAASTDFAVFMHLIEKGADIHLYTPHGCYGSLLIAAMQSHSTKLVEFLLDQGVEVDQIPDGEDVVFGTALIAGAYWGFTSGVQMLLDAGAQVNLRTEVGNFGNTLVAARADLTDEGGVFKDTPWYDDEDRDEWKSEVEELLLKYGATE